MSSIPIPSKGDIVTIENKQYRVLKVSGTIVEVLTMYDASTSQLFNATDKTVVFPSGDKGQQYKGSALDTYLNETFFATLSTTMQAAIVPKNIHQDMWGRNYNEVPTKQFWYKQYDEEFIYDEFGFVDVGERRSYLLSVQDVIDYLGLSNHGQITQKAIWNMFFNVDTAVNNILWLRSAFNTYSTTVWYIAGSNGKLQYNASYSSKNNVRCAFQIDWDILYPSTPTLTFKHFYDAGTIGSGTVKFRHYSQTEPIPQLATPQNVTANGTTVSWDEVENATSYAVLADGSEIGTVEQQTGYAVTFICQNGIVGFNYSIDNMSADLSIDKGETKNIIVTEYLFIKSRGMTPEVVSYSGGILDATGGFGRWKFTPTQNNSTITVVDND